MRWSDMINDSPPEGLAWLEQHVQISSLYGTAISEVTVIILDDQLLAVNWSIPGNFAATRHLEKLQAGDGRQEGRPRNRRAWCPLINLILWYAMVARSGDRPQFAPKRINTERRQNSFTNPFFKRRTWDSNPPVFQLPANWQVFVAIPYLA